MGFVQINETDNVLVNLDNGHKYAKTDIKQGEKIIKYGYAIGVATKDISKGDHVHSHNLKTALSGVKQYSYIPVNNTQKVAQPINIMAYQRSNGDIGIRNDIFVVTTVGCVNDIAKKIAQKTNTIAITHPFGCSQLGGDHLRTQQVLAGIVKHPNAAGVLVLGLGCENNNICEFKKILGTIDDSRIKFLNCQDVNDEIQAGIDIVNQLKNLANDDKRVSVPISKLKIGMKCGGSDGLSGITANPLCGKITDKLTSMGGCAVLTEVPEMFGAEECLFSRCKSEYIFDKANALINNYKKYFISHNEPISENPSPGNKEGGITTLEEKSLGCITKGGTATITDVLTYGEVVSKSGLSLLNGPGNDIVAITNLTCAGCHLILFTTGRGTPLGAPIPTLKIATNTKLKNNKPDWIDFDAQQGTEQQLFDLIVKTVDGAPTKNEKNAYHQISIMKDGVTL